MTTDLKTTGKPKRSTRSKKIEQSTSTEQTISFPYISKISPQLFVKLLDYFSELSVKIEEAKKEIVNFQKEVTEVREAWEKEKFEHEKGIAARNAEVALARKREGEEYEYQKKVEERKAEDEFIEKRNQWERQLREEKDKIEAERKELSELRGKVASFEDELQKTVEGTRSVIIKDLEAKYANEKKLREQEFKSEKDILTLKIDSLSKENSRQTAEIEVLKKALDEATRQLKDIAVKVIEGRTPKVVGTSEI